MTTTSAPSLAPPVLPDQDELIRRLLSDTPLLKDTPDHLLQVVNVLESYGLVLDAYSKNLRIKEKSRCSILSGVPLLP